MRRRYRQSPMEDLIEIASYLPWWVGILLAIMSYLVLHSLAIDDAVIPINGVKNLGEVAILAIVKVIIIFMQYIVPMAFAFGAIISLIKWNK